ncbi:MAG: TadA family conjugal transfer-associated ATPase [Ornithinimicrobium sp.]
MSAIDPLVQEEIDRGQLPTADRVSRISRAQRLRLGSEGAAEVERTLGSDVLGLGPLQALTTDERVTDILVNGSRGVWLDRGDGLEQAAVHLQDDAALRRLAVRLAAMAGQRLDDAAPYVDGLLPGGIRLHAVLPPLVDGAAHISLRIPRRVPPSLAVLRAWGMFDEGVEALLRQIVNSKIAFVVGGGTGSGKTTLLSALLAQVPHAERIVVVEDVRELAIAHPHVIHLQGRAANVEGRGEIALTTLIRQSLRMRPDRVVLGEARGPEVRELMTAMNTGHEGGCGTIHANSAGDVISRFEALGALAGLGPAAVHTQLASAVQVVLHLDRAGTHRQLGEIAVLGVGDGRVEVTSVCRRVGADYVRGPGWEQLEQLIAARGPR